MHESWTFLFALFEKVDGREGFSISRQKTILFPPKVSVASWTSHPNYNSNNQVQLQF